MKKSIALGISRFKELVDRNIYFVDKTLLIKEFMEDNSKILVLPRPRRFGKTLNISMIKYFLDNRESSKNLFTNLEIEKDKEFVEANLNKHPVIHISLKDAKRGSWEESLDIIRDIMSVEYKRHSEIKESLDDGEKEYYEKIVSGGEEKDIAKSLLNLSMYLNKHYKKDVVVLVDEYDATIHKAYITEYYKESIEFFQMFYGAVFKDNIYLKKGLMTGILRVSKESLFSGLNNVEVVSLLSDRYSKYFGFTEEESVTFAKNYGVDIEGMKDWYNGYRIGHNKVYNPWSIINYIKNKGELKEYWINTSSNDLIYDIVKKTGNEYKRDILKLVAGYSLRKNINENVNLQNLEGEEAFYSLLLFSGYLTWEESLISRYKDLKVPNIEVKSFFSDLLLSLSEPKSSIGRIVDSLERKDWEKFGRVLSKYLEDSFSYYDLSENSREKDYHLIMMGILFSVVSGYEIKSNRESGEGRYDILLKNRVTNEGIVFELKKSLNKESLDRDAERAIEQIESRGYGKDLKGLIKIGISFHGKRSKLAWS